MRGWDFTSAVSPRSCSPPSIPWPAVVLCRASELPLAEHRDTSHSRQSRSGHEQKYRPAWQKTFMHSLQSPTLALQAVTSPAVALPTRFLKALMSSFAQPLQPPHLCRSLGLTLHYVGRLPLDRGCWHLMVGRSHHQSGMEMRSVIKGPNIRAGW